MSCFGYVRGPLCWHYMMMSYFLTSCVKFNFSLSSRWSRACRKVDAGWDTHEGESSTSRTSGLETASWLLWCATSARQGILSVTVTCIRTDMTLNSCVVDIIRFEPGTGSRLLYGYYLRSYLERYSLTTVLSYIISLQIPICFVKGSDDQTLKTPKTGLYLAKCRWMYLFVSNEGCCDRGNSWCRICSWWRTLWWTCRHVWSEEEAGQVVCMVVCIDTWWEFVVSGPLCGNQHWNWENIFHCWSQGSCIFAFFIHRS